MNEGYIVQNACANCEHVKQFSAETDFYQCCVDGPPIQAPSLHAQLPSLDRIKQTLAAQQWYAKTEVEPHGICSKWERKAVHPVDDPTIPLISTEPF